MTCAQESQPRERRGRESGERSKPRQRRRERGPPSRSAGLTPHVACRPGAPTAAAPWTPGTLQRAWSAVSQAVGRRSGLGPQGDPSLLQQPKTKRHTGEVEGDSCLLSAQRHDAEHGCVSFPLVLGVQVTPESLVTDRRASAGPSQEQDCSSSSISVSASFSWLFLPLTKPASPDIVTPFPLPRPLGGENQPKGVRFPDSQSCQFT